MYRSKHFKLLFWIYCATMLALLFWRSPALFPGSYGERVLELLNPVPFETICRFLRLLGHPSSADVRVAAVNLFGNIFLFVPLGLLLPEVYPKLRRWWKTMLVTAGAVMAVELGQMLTLLGTCDIDDLILNLLGAAIGYGLFLIVHKNKGSAAR